MKIKWFYRLIALLMVLILVVVVPVQVSASGLAAAGTWLMVNADVVIPAVVAAVGLWAGVESGAFESIVDACTTDMKSLGYVTDDQIQAYIVDGKSYIGQDIIEAVRDWLFASKTVEEKTFGPAGATHDIRFADYSIRASGSSVLFECYCTVSSSGAWWVVASTEAGFVKITDAGVESTLDHSIRSVDGVIYYYVYGKSSQYTSAVKAAVEAGTLPDLGSMGGPGLCDYAVRLYTSGEVVTTQDLTLGNLAPKDVPIASGYSTWYENAYVIEGTGGSGDEDPDDNTSKTLLPLSLLTAGLALTLTQDQAQTGDTDIEVEEDSGTDSGGHLGGMGGRLDETDPGSFIENFVDGLWEPFRWLGNMLLEGIRAIFVPEADFLTEKVNAIRAEFAFADAIISTSDFFKTSLAGLGTEPPIIYIDLGATEGSYNIGGKMVFMDLSWYERYKATGDAILSAFLWLIFVWRIILKLPGIISGMPGDWVMDSVNSIGVTDHLPSRKAAYEVHRQSIRQSIRRGKG